MHRATVRCNGERRTDCTRSLLQSDAAEHCHSGREACLRAPAEVGVVTVAEPPCVAQPPLGFASPMPCDRFEGLICLRCSRLLQHPLCKQLGSRRQMHMCAIKMQGMATGREIDEAELGFHELGFAPLDLRGNDVHSLDSTLR